MTKATKLFLVVLFSLAAVGLVVALQNTPTTVILSILFAAVVLFVLSRFTGFRGGTGNDKGYQKALRKQKQRGKMSPGEVQKLTKLKRPSSSYPFKVIEGHKGKSSKEKEKKTNFH